MTSTPRFQPPNASPLPPVLSFRPILKEKPWGGRRLEALLGRPLPAGARIGESWEISDHGRDLSVVAGGPFAGRTLRDLIQERAGELLGGPPRPFPLLLKALDADESLSVQVHPADAEAAVLEPGGRGKNESWAILDAAPGARIVRGLAPGLELREFYRRMEELARPEGAAGGPAAASGLLDWLEVRRGDVIYLPAGTIHAIGAGVVLVEVQQSSDITYRIHDWGRPRDLHLEKARRLPPAAGPAAVGRWMPDRPAPRMRWRAAGGAHFSIDALYLEPGGGELSLETGIESGGHAGGAPAAARFGILIGLEGAARLESRLGAAPARRGDFLLIPAASGRVLIQAAGERPFSGLWVREGGAGD